MSVTSNSGVRVNKIILRENVTWIEYNWLSSGSSEMEGAKKYILLRRLPYILKSLLRVPGYEWLHN